MSLLSTVIWALSPWVKYGISSLQTQFWWALLRQHKDTVQLSPHMLGQLHSSWGWYQCGRYQLTCSLHIHRLNFLTPTLSYILSERMCAHECLSLCTKSFSCMLWLPFCLSFICYKNTVMFFNIQVQLSTIKELYFPHKASTQSLLGCQLPCRLVLEIRVNERKDEQVKEQRGKIQWFGAPWTFFSPECM